MADELDALLQGEQDQSNPPSQGKIEGQNADSSQEQQPGEQQSLEEVEFNKLSGSAQDRIRKLITQKREAENKLSNALSGQAPVYSGYNPQQPSDVADAVRKLSDVGIATKEDVNKTVKENISQLRYEYELNRLEGRYTGDNGEPKFDRVEYEDYVSSHPQFRNYLPEDVYRKMYNEELLSIELDKRQNPANQRNARTLRPVRTQQQQETLTPEYIEDRLKQPDGPQWYAENKDKIDVAVSKMSSQ